MRVRLFGRYRAFSRPMLSRHRWLLIPIIAVPATLVLIVPMMIVALVKRVVPIERVRIASRRVVVWIADCWLDLLVGLLRRCLDTQVEVTGERQVNPSKSYV